MICVVDEAITQGEVRSKRGVEHWVALASCVLAPLALVAMGAFLVPSPNGHGTHEQLGLPPCRMIQWFGIPCPGCGVTTSVTLAAQGHFEHAFVTQPFGVVCFLIGVAALPWALWVQFSGRDAFGELRRYSRWKVWVVLFTLMAISWAWKVVATLTQ